jgi:hypothetical protein
MPAGDKWDLTRHLKKLISSLTISAFTSNVSNTEDVTAVQLEL